MLTSRAHCGPTYLVQWPCFPAGRRLNCRGSDPRPNAEPGSLDVFLRRCASTCCSCVPNSDRRIVFPTNSFLCGRYLHTRNTTRFHFIRAPKDYFAVGARCSRRNLERLPQYRDPRGVPAAPIVTDAALRLHRLTSGNSSFTAVLPPDGALRRHTGATHNYNKTPHCHELRTLAT